MSKLCRFNKVILYDCDIILTTVTEINIFLIWPNTSCLSLYLIKENNKHVILLTENYLQASVVHIIKWKHILLIIIWSKEAYSNLTPKIVWLHPFTQWPISHEHELLLSVPIEECTLAVQSFFCAVLFHLKAHCAALFSCWFW